MIAAPTISPLALYETQDDFVHDTRRYPCFLAGRNSGKTFAGATKAALRCTEPGLGVIAAPDFPMLEFGAKRQFKERLDDLGLRFLEQKSLNTLTVPATGAEVVFATLENESRIRGPNFHWAWPDELEYVSHRPTWLALKGAVRAGPHPQIFPTSTPKGRRLIWEEWVRDGDAAHALYTATTYDNPFIDAAAYVGGLGYTGQFYAQEIEAQFVAFEGLVYPGFHRAQVQRVECHDWPAALALDPAPSAPTALLTVRFSGDSLHIERELYRRDMGASAIVAACAEEYARAGASFLVFDPSPGSLLLTDLRRHGLHVRKANKLIGEGIARVTSSLPSLTVDPSCVHTIAEFETYQWPDQAKTERDVPLKASDHAMDALRYAVMELRGVAKKVRFL